MSEGAARTRAALVELAATLFSEEGYIQTSMRDLARRAEMTTGAVYGHFRNKADLLAAAIERRTADELEAPSTAGEAPDHVETLTRMSRAFPSRRRLRALLVQGAAASHTDPATRERLREEQQAHIDAWVAGYEAHRERLGIDESVDVRDAVLYSWAAELGLGVLEAIGIEPASADGWADAANRFARGLQLPPALSPAGRARPRGRPRPSSARARGR